MALTDEQHAMLQTIHHMTKLAAPQERAWLAKSLRALEVSNNARFKDLRSQHQNILKAIAVISVSGGGPTAQQIAKAVVDEQHRRLKE